MLDLRKLLASAMKAKRPEDLDQPITDVRLEGFRVNGEISQLASECPRILRDEPGAALEKHDAMIAAAKRQRERVDLAIADLERLAGELTERQVEAKRRKQYEDTVRERDAVANELREKYPALAGEIASILERLGQVERQIGETNKDLPAGAALLEPLEHSLRRPRGSEPAPPLAEAVNLPAMAGGDLNHWPAGTIR